MCFIKKLIFIAHSKQSNNHNDNMIIYVFNVSQLYSMSLFLKASF